MKRVTRKGKFFAPAFTAIIAIATAFTFNACSGEPDDEGGSSSSGGGGTELSSGGNGGGGSSSSGGTDIGGGGDCTGFVEGTTRQHYGKSKPQFCDPRDGKKYVYVNINSQDWMAENLNYNAAGSICFDNDLANCAKYGRYYNWATAVNACPDGWHTPSREEWRALIDFARRDNNAAVNNQATYLKAAEGWKDHARYGNGIDTYGFTALAGGYSVSGRSFLSEGSDGYWWSSEEYSNGSTTAYLYHISHNSNSVRSVMPSKSSLRNLRCVRGNSGGTDIGGEDSFDENSQIYYPSKSPYTGNGTIKAELYRVVNDNTERYDEINAGSVINGVVNLQLPSSIPDGASGNAATSYHEQCEVYPSDAKVAIALLKLYDGSGELIGYLTTGTKTSYSSYYIEERIHYYYFTKDTYISCGFDYDASDMSDMDLSGWTGLRNTGIDAKTGWNRIYEREYYFESEESYERYQSTDYFLDDVIWWLVEE